MPANETMPIDEAEEILAAGFEAALDDLAEYYRDVAKRIWPRGAVLRCPRCGLERTASTGEMAGYLGRGWPECHGLPMQSEQPPTAPPRERI